MYWLFTREATIPWHVNHFAKNWKLVTNGINNLQRLNYVWIFKLICESRYGPIIYEQVLLKLESTLHCLKCYFSLISRWFNLISLCVLLIRSHQMLAITPYVAPCRGHLVRFIPFNASSPNALEKSKSNTPVQHKKQRY